MPSSELAALLLRVEELEALLKNARTDIEERQSSFNLRWEADMRAIKYWREMGGAELVWPDHVDLCVWLMEELVDWKRAAGAEASERRRSHIEIRQLKKIIANYEALEKQ